MHKKRKQLDPKLFLQTKNNLDQNGFTAASNLVRAAKIFIGTLSNNFKSIDLVGKTSHTIDWQTLRMKGSTSCCKL